jgi:protease II
MMTPPKAEKRPYPITIHGDTRVDDYYWLRDDERADRQVLDYLQAENAYTDAMLKPQAGAARNPVRRDGGAHSAAGTFGALRAPRLSLSDAL